jgi:hypothetical protein
MSLFKTEKVLGLLTAANVNMENKKSESTVLKKNIATIIDSLRRSIPSLKIQIRHPEGDNDLLLNLNNLRLLVVL